MSLFSSSDRDSSLRRSLSVPHISSSSRTDSGLGYSGSCSDLDQLSQYQYGYVNHYHHHHHHHNPESLNGTPTHHRHHNHHHRQEPKTNSRLVTDLRQLLTLRQHYYPEGGWGWLITAIGLIMQCIAHGLHMSAGVIIVEIMRTFRVSSIRAGDEINETKNTEQEKDSFKQFKSSKMYHFNNFSSLFVIVETNLNLILPKVGLLSFHLVHHPLSQSIVLFCPSPSSKIARKSCY